MGGSYSTGPVGAQPCRGTSHSAIVTGFRWISPELTAATLLRTVLVVHICDAMLCRLFAHNNGYSKNLWTTLGLRLRHLGGRVLLVLPKRAEPRREPVGR